MFDFWNWFTADQIFATLVFMAWPATLIYPVAYHFISRGAWKRSWIGRALMTKAVGVAMLLTFSALYQLFGPGYWGRDAIRITGMFISLIGFWLVLYALLKVYVESGRYIAAPFGKRQTDPAPFGRRRTDEPQA